MPRLRVEVEREEGEIVDELDDLSDISSEEELLRQRLEVLEDYNHVLERKKGKSSTNVRSKDKKRNMSPDIFDLSAVASSYGHAYPRSSKIPRKIIHNKKKKNACVIHKPSKRKNIKVHKKSIVISESSEDSDIEYRNKRRKLNEAVNVKRNKTDSSLKNRLMKMIHNSTNPIGSAVSKAPNTIIDKDIWIRIESNSVIPHTNITTKCPAKIVGRPKVQEDAILGKKCVTVTKLDKCVTDPEQHDLSIIEHNSNKKKNINFKCDKSTGKPGNDNTQIIEYHATSESKLIYDSVPNNTYEENSTKQNNSTDVVDAALETIKIQSSENESDDDLELLRQYALKSKIDKTQETTDILESKIESESKPSLASEDEDSDTAELRLICLRSALLKKAIEMKQKQKLRKRLSQSSSLYDDIISNDVDLVSKTDKDNNTDIESVDMDIGSDGPESDEKEKRLIKNVTGNNCISNDDFEEDEDLLRAKLLTSLSKNLPMLVDPTELEIVGETKSQSENKKPTKIEVHAISEEKRFIINTGGSDSEDEHEATKNLTKTHLKLSEHVDFQHKLDMFLKTTRMEVEKTNTPSLDETRAKPLLKTPQKFIPKAVTHLPKSEQIEYKNLVKRMAELEKLKQVRQQAMNIPKAPYVQPKKGLQPRSVTIDASKKHTFDLEEQISMSRKKIAEESSRVMQLKEEGTKLAQKYKIVATELRNLSTAMSLNKRQQKLTQGKLSQIRTEHQQLLRRSKAYKHMEILQNRSRLPKFGQVTLSTESIPSKANFFDLKAVTVSVVNDISSRSDTKENVPTDLMVKIDIESNKKQVVAQDDNGDVKNTSEENARGSAGECPADYTSPLQALCSVGWSEDPNGVLCPFEVGGSCKDERCRYLHPKAPAPH